MSVNLNLNVPDGRRRGRGVSWPRTPGALALLLVAATSPARAQEAPAAAILADGIENWHRAREAEARHDPHAALLAYRTVVRDAPQSRLAERARGRIAWLEARAEGDFVPLARMLAFRDRSPPSADDAARFEEHVRQLPPGRVRVESWALIGDAWLALDAPDRARDAFGTLLEEPDATDEDRLQARTGLHRTGPPAGSVGEADGSVGVAAWVCAVVLFTMGAFALARRLRARRDI